jgi:hypothetical protein
MKLHLLVLTAVLAVCVLPAARAEDADVLRVYDVGVLLAGEMTAPFEILGLPPGVGTLEEFLEEEEEDAEPAPFIDGDALVEIVDSAVSRTGGDLRADVEVQGRQLVVRAPPAAQAIVERTLGALWRAAAQRIVVEGTWVRVGAEGRGALHTGGLLERLQGGRLDAETHRAVLATVRDVSGDISSAATAVRSGRRGTLGRVRSQSYVRDYDVEIAQDSRVGNPIVWPLGTGWFADLRPCLLQDGSVLIDVVGQVARVEGPIRLQALEVEPFGSIELPVCSVLRFAGSGRAMPGQTLAWVSAPEGEAGLLDVLMLRPVVRSTAGEPGRIRRYDVSRLTTPPVRWRMARIPAAQHHQRLGMLTPWRLVPAEPWEPLIEEDMLLDAIVLEFGEETWERGGTSMLQVTGALVVEGDAALHAGIAKLLGARERALDTERVAVRLLATDDAGETREIGAAWLDLPYGRSVGWQSGTERAYVADWDVEVAQEERVGDPIVEKVVEGLALTLVLGRAPVEGRALLRLDLSWTDVHPEIEVRRLENECTGIVEVPKLDLLSARQDLVLEFGVPEIVEAGNLPDGRAFQVEIVLAR